MYMPPYFLCMYRVVVAGSVDLNKRVIEAIEQEHEPYYNGDSALWMSSVITALGRGHVLVGCTYDKVLIVASPDGTVTFGGEPIQLTLNAKRDDLLRPVVTELNVSLRDDRGARWVPRVEIPGDFFDTAYVFYALVGWQGADLVAIRAMGCHDCAGSCLVLVDTGAVGRLFVGCACQEIGPDAPPDDEPPLPREDAVLAVEEEGTWYTGADLGAAA